MGYRMARPQKIPENLTPTARTSQTTDRRQTDGFPMVYVNAAQVSCFKAYLFIVSFNPRCCLSHYCRMLVTFIAIWTRTQPTAAVRILMIAGNFFKVEVLRLTPPAALPVRLMIDRLIGLWWMTVIVVDFSVRTVNIPPHTNKQTNKQISKSEKTLPRSFFGG